MTYRTLLIAGWLAMCSAFLSIPLAYVTLRLEGRADTLTMALQSGLQLFGALLFIAITLYLKKMLNGLFAFRDADRTITMMIMANATASVLVLAGMYLEQFKENLSIAALVIVVMQGIMQIRFGFQLKKLPNNLSGLLKPYCYFNMLTGICVASVVLIVAGVAVSAVADLMLGTIFFNLARQLHPAGNAAD